MSAARSPRPRRVAGHRPVTSSAGRRPRRVADSRRVAVRTAEAPERDGAGAGPASRIPSVPTGAGTRRPRPVTWILAALAVVAALLVGLLAWGLARMDDRADAAKAAQVVATDSIEAILSYDHAEYDKGATAAARLMTDGFAEEYAKTVEAVRPEVMQTESVVTAEVVGASVVSARPDDVAVLLFVNQTTEGRQVQQPRVDLNRVVVDLEEQDGTWLVADIDAL